MTPAKANFDINMSESQVCLSNFDEMSHDFALRHVWIISVSSLDFYLTELISDISLQWIDRTPPQLTPSLGQIRVPLMSVLESGNLSPTEKLLQYKHHVFSAVRFTSFYKPEKISEALSYIWLCPAKEKWSRITNRMKSYGNYHGKTEKDIRDELTFIGERRDLIAHSADILPGANGPNPVTRPDAAHVVQFINDLADAIDNETEAQL